MRYIYKKDNKFYLIGPLEGSNHLYRIEETFIQIITNHHLKWWFAPPYKGMVLA